MKNFVVSQWGLLSSIDYHVFLSPDEQDQPASQSSSPSFENLISTEVENNWNDDSPTNWQFSNHFSSLFSCQTERVFLTCNFIKKVTLAQVLSCEF